MSNELINWIPFSVETTRLKNFNQFLDIIKKIDPLTSLDSWVKWKDDSHQLVVGTKDYYYKLYQTDIQSGSFFVKIREELANIYQDLYNIHWVVKTVYQQNQIFQIEQREKLKVCDKNIPFEKILLGWNKTLELLEERLLLDKILKQLPLNIQQKVSKIKLIRDCMNKYDDYAITNNNEIILLDDADWFLAFVDKNGNWISSKSNIFSVISSIGETFLAPFDLYERNLLNLANEEVNRWNIFISDINLEKTQKQLISMREEFISNNIKILTTNKYANEILLLEK